MLEDGNEPDIFWGLLAVETISLAKVMIYHFMFLIAAIVLWRASHGWNTSAPVLAVIGMVSVFWGLVLYK